MAPRLPRPLQTPTDRAAATRPRRRPRRSAMAALRRSARPARQAVQAVRYVHQELLRVRGLDQLPRCTGAAPAAAQAQ